MPDPRFALARGLESAGVPVTARSTPPSFVVQTVVLGVGFCALYAACAREALHPPDAARFIQQAHAHDLNEHHHFVYNRIACAVAAGASTFGVSAFAALRALSAIGGALAVAFAHRAFLRCGLEVRRATSGALLVGACPALGYYATTVEIHAPHLASVALAFWSLAAAVDPRGGEARQLFGAARTGLLTGLSATIHSTGHLLVFVVVVPLLRSRQRALAIAALLGAHALACSLIAMLAGEGVVRAQASYIVPFLSDPPSVAAVARSLWHEWLVALAPIAGVGLLACVRGRAAVEARWLHLAFVPYFVTTVVLLRGVVLDHGSYVLPLAVPLAWLCARLVPPRFAWALAAFGLGIAWYSLPPTAGLARQRQFGDAVVAFDRATPVRILGLTAEVDAVARQAPAIPAGSLLVLHAMRGRPLDFLPALTAAFDQQVNATFAAGRVPLLTAAGAAWLRSAPGDLLWRLYAEHIEVRYRLEPVDRGALAGWLLRPRS